MTAANALSVRCGRGLVLATWTFALCLGWAVTQAQDRAGAQPADTHAGHAAAADHPPHEHASPGATFVPAPPAPAGTPLVDLDGRDRGTLENPGNDRWTGLFFVRGDCPISNHYVPEIKRICAEYAAAGLECLLVYSDPYTSVDDVRTHLDDYDYSLPAILDTKRAWAGRAGATITPEVAVFARGGTLEYRGRIDDLYAELGRPRQRVTERDLRAALDDLVAGRTVGKPRTQATGCFIE